MHERCNTLRHSAKLLTYSNVALQVAPTSTAVASAITIHEELLVGTASNTSDMKDRPAISALAGGEGYRCWL
ncbi:hypothetical protein MRX96_058962 [Rhipicephalus microplus]